MRTKVLLISFLFFSVIGAAQQLDELIQIASKNNPTLSALELQTQITKEGEIQAQSWRNTAINTAVFISEPETRTGPQRYQLSASQPIPAFGRITARKNYAKSLTDINYQEWVIAKRKLILNVTQVYYNYQLLLRQRELLKTHLERIDLYIDIATTKVSVSKATVIDVFELKMRKEEFDNNYKQLQASIEQLDAELKSLLNSDDRITIVLDPNFKISKNELSDKSTALEVHPELAVYNLIYESVVQQQTLNNKERLPSLGLGINYINVSNRGDLNPIDNGKDILAPMLSLSLPIFNKTYKSKDQQLVLRAEQIKNQQLNRKNLLQKGLDQAIALRKKAIIDFNSQSYNLKLAQESLNLVLSQYQTNIKSVDKLLDIQQLEFNYAYKKIAAINTYFKAQLQIEYLVKL